MLCFRILSLNECFSHSLRNKGEVKTLCRLLGKWHRKLQLVLQNVMFKGDSYLK